jgi:hypothetical protein
MCGANDEPAGQSNIAVQAPTSGETCRSFQRMPPCENASGKRLPRQLVNLDGFVLHPRLHGFLLRVALLLVIHLSFIELPSGRLRG